MSRKRIIAGLALFVIAGVARADFVLGPPQNLGPVVNSGFHDVQPSISADGLTLYFVSDRPGGLGSLDVWMTKRSSVSAPWGPPVNLGAPVNNKSDECSPSISSDGLTLYFTDNTPGGFSTAYRPGGLGHGDIWMATRASLDAPWTTPVNLGAPLNTPDSEAFVSISRDDLALLFTSNREGSTGYNLWMSMRPTAEAPWIAPVRLDSTVNRPGTMVFGGSLAPDGLALLFSSYGVSSSGAKSFGGWDLWMTTRKGMSAPWNPPVNLGPAINTSGFEMDPILSADGQTLYFSTSVSSTLYLGDDLWQATITPIVDFNGDGKVDLADLTRLIQSWGKDDPAVDIGPYPWGDGIIDVKDLEVLVGHWTRDPNEPTAVAQP